jgi:DNA-binding MarR family transcriptional regulator
VARKEVPEEINILNCVNLRLRMLTRIVNKMYADPLRSLGISTGQQNILFAVGKMKRIPQNELGKVLFLERSSVTRELDGLVKKRLIRKSSDFPSPMIELTPSGVSLFQAIIPAWSSVQAHVLDAIGKEGSQSIDKLLKSLKK